MGKVWSVDAIAKNGSTDIYGQTTSIAESSLDENILWVGTDDGLLWITRDGGLHWDQMDNLPGVPERSYVHQVIASQFDKNTAYVCFNHHRYGDFKPYLLKTTDGGKTWKSLSATLPERGSVYSIAEDHVDRNLLFCGTEFGVFFTQDGGENWVQLKAGLPTIAVRDIEIQRRENDLVLGTFGRGFYILDDYTPLRNLNKETFDQETVIFPIKDAWMFVQNKPLGLRDKGHMGSSYYAAANPPVGAVFTYYLKNDIKTLKAKRQEAEKAKFEKKEVVNYPEMEALRKEDEQPEPYLLFTITDAAGKVVRHLKAPAKKGLQRIVWDMRYATSAPVTGRFKPGPDQLFGEEDKGHLAMPGQYSVSLSKFEDGALSALTGPVAFTTKSLNNATLPAKDLPAYQAFCEKVSNLRRVVSAANNIRAELNGRLSAVQSALLDMPAAPQELTQKVYDIERKLNAAKLLLNGDNTRSSREFETNPSITGRINLIEDGMWNTTSAPNETFKQMYQTVAKQFTPLLEDLKSIDRDIEAVEHTLEINRGPATPGRWPEWKRE